MSLVITDALRKRFWSKVEIGQPHECWVWLRASRGVGYGCLKIGGKVHDSHRVAYMISFGEIPDGMLVLHKCDNRACCNPSHLELGTYRDNSRDAAKRGRLWRTPRRKPLTDAELIEVYESYRRGISKRELCRKWSIPATSMTKIVDLASRLDRQRKEN